MSNILFVYSKCSTCQKAVKFLDACKFKYSRKEITETPPSIAELQQMLKFQNGNIKKLFNTSGMQYREMNLQQKLSEMSLNEALVLLSQNGMLVKRPFLLTNTFGLLGFREPEWQERLK